MIAPHQDLLNHGSTVSGKVLTENPHRKHASQRGKSHSGGLLISKPLHLRTVRMRKYSKARLKDYNPDFVDRLSIRTALAPLLLLPNASRTLSSTFNVTTGPRAYEKDPEKGRVRRTIKFFSRAKSVLSTIFR